MRRWRDDARLSAYHDGMLGARELRGLQRLLDDQPEVQERYQELRRTIETVRQLPDPEPPDEFWANAIVRLREMAQEEAPAIRARQAVARALGIAALAAALWGLLTLSIGFWPRPEARGDLAALRRIYANTASSVVGIDRERLSLTLSPPPDDR